MKTIFILILLFSIPLISCGGDNQGDDNVSFAQQLPTPGVSKKKIKSLAEITDDLEKVTLDSYVVDSDQDPLGRIACDLKKSLPKPLGEFSSRLILLNKRLITVFKRGLYTADQESVLNQILEDTLQLKEEINEAASTMPGTENNSLVFLEGLSKAAEKTKINAVALDKKFKEMVEHNAVLQHNLSLASEQECLKKEIKFKMDLLIATKLMYELVNKWR